MPDDATATGNNGPAPMTEDEFLGFIVDLDDAQSELAEALAACKAPRKRVKEVKDLIAERMNFAAFERAMADRLKPGYQRVEENAEYKRNMAWLGKPVPEGGQSAMEFTVRDPGVAELKAIDVEGYEAGRAGHAADTNTYTPGDERYARFENAWKRGYDAFIAEQTKIAESMAPDQPKKRGRPKGSGKKKAGGATAQPDPTYDDEGEEPLPLEEAAPAGELVH